MTIDPVTLGHDIRVELLEPRRILLFHFEDRVFVQLIPRLPIPCPLAVGNHVHTKSSTVSAAALCYSSEFCWPLQRRPALHAKSIVEFTLRDLGSATYLFFILIFLASLVEEDRNVTLVFSAPCCCRFRAFSVCLFRPVLALMSSQRQYMCTIGME